MTSTDLSKFLASLQPGGEPHRLAMDAARRALNLYAQAALTNARQRAPIKTGDLRRSATALPTEGHNGQLTKTIGFNMSYAAAVHERLDLHHPEGEAKFLENAINQMPDLEQYLLTEIENAL
ncbi:MAG: HK97 gp10 family phage protein [Phycisphaerales bacterium]|nr:HK97 gp10 family phage protein [Phycisphaerales bacterium]